MTQTHEASWGSLPADFRPESYRQRQRRMGEEYRLARHAETLVEEHTTYGHRTEAHTWAETHQRLNLGAWLKERAADTDPAGQHRSTRRQSDTGTPHRHQEAPMSESPTATPTNADIKAMQVARKVAIAKGALKVAGTVLSALPEHQFTSGSVGRSVRQKVTVKVDGVERECFLNVMLTFSDTVARDENGKALSQVRAEAKAAALAGE